MELAPGTAIQVKIPAPSVTPVYHSRGEKGEKGDPGTPGGSDANFAGYVNDPASQTSTALKATYGRKPDLRERLATKFYIAHRGGGGSIYPEHTMEGYQAAALSGFPIEADIRRLADGTLVCHHDQTTARTMSGADTDVETMTRDTYLTRQVLPVVPGGKKLSPIEWEDILGQFGGRVPIMAEIKTNAAVSDVIDTVTSRGLQDSVFLSSSVFASATAIADAGCSAGYLVGATATETPATIAAAGVEWIIHSTTATAADVAAWVAAGLKPIVYTSSDRGSLTTYFANGDVGVYTDDPWWASARIPSVVRDQFNHRVGWIGHQKPSGTAFTLRSKTDGTTRLFVQNAAVATMGHLGPFVRGQKVSFKFRHLNVGTAAHAMRVYFHTAAKLNPTESELNWYLAMFRRSGNLDAYEKTATGPTLLTEAAGSKNAFLPAVTDSTDAGTDFHVQLELTSTQLIFRRLDTGASVTYPATGVTASPFYLSMGTLTGSAAVEIFDILVE